MDDVLTGSVSRQQVVLKGAGKKLSLVGVSQTQRFKGADMTFNCVMGHNEWGKRVVAVWFGGGSNDLQ